MTIKRNFAKSATIPSTSSKWSKPSSTLQSRIDAFNKSTPKRKQTHAESDLQRTCVQWFRLQYPYLIKLLFSIPNGGSRNVIEASRLKQEGVVAGVSDLILLTPSSDAEYHGLCIEMKTTERSSKQSPEQLAFQTASEEQGYHYAIARTLDDFQAIIKSHLE